ncbi:MAG TPA: hypothetical protein VIW46_11350 [Acidimicrobiia bacterium]
MTATLDRPLREPADPGAPQRDDARLTGEIGPAMIGAVLGALFGARFPVIGVLVATHGLDFAAAHGSPLP